MTNYEVNLSQKVFAGNRNAQWDKGVTYETSIPERIIYNETTKVVGGNDVNYVKNLPNTTNLHGFSSLYSPNFCKGVR